MQPTNTSRRSTPAPTASPRRGCANWCGWRSIRRPQMISKTGSPHRVLADSRLPALREALQYVHRPPADAPVELLLDWRHPAQRRLAFEELLAHQLSLKLLRQRIQRDPGWPLAAPGALKAALLAALPFRPTRAQQRVLHEIERDLGLATPMLRLVQGDVGCGKTLVAALAATQAVQMGRQVALMAPTELLADQHAQNFRRWFEPLGVEVALLTGRQTGKARGAVLERIRGGRGAAGHRHARALSRRSGVCRACAGDRRRAAPLRRASAPVPARKGRSWRPPAASIDHDRDADSAHAGDDRLRGPRRVDHR